VRAHELHGLSPDLSRISSPGIKPFTYFRRRKCQDEIVASEVNLSIVSLQASDSAKSHMWRVLQ